MFCKIESWKFAHADYITFISVYFMIHNFPNYMQAKKAKNFLYLNVKLSIIYKRHLISKSNPSQGQSPSRASGLNESVGLCAEDNGSRVAWGCQEN